MSWDLVDHGMARLVVYLVCWIGLRLLWEAGSACQAIAAWHALPPTEAEGAAADDLAAFWAWRRVHRPRPTEEFRG